MLRIAIGGQLAKKENAELVEKYGEGKVEVKVYGDLQAAMAVKTKQADYYLGSCQTGAGGALAMAISLLGFNKCISVAMVGKVLDDEEIVAAIKDGKIAFGFVPEAAHSVIPVIMKELLKNE